MSTLKSEGILTFSKVKLVPLSICSSFCGKTYQAVCKKKTKLSKMSVICSRTAPRAPSFS